MSVIERDRALELLSEFIGGEIASIECDEFQLRLTFQDKSQFVTQSSWRLVLREDLLIGSGDAKERASEEVFKHLKGLKIKTVTISNVGDTQLQFEHDHDLEVIANSVQYETWEAHITAGWVVFAVGGTTVFPSVPAPPNASDRSSGTS